MRLRPRGSGNTRERDRHTDSGAAKLAAIPYIQCPAIKLVDRERGFITARRQPGSFPGCILHRHLCRHRHDRTGAEGEYERDSRHRHRELG